MVLLGLRFVSFRSGPLLSASFRFVSARFLVSSRFASPRFGVSFVFRLFAFFRFKSSNPRLGWWGGAFTRAESEGGVVGWRVYTCKAGVVVFGGVGWVK